MSTKIVQNRENITIQQAKTARHILFLLPPKKMATALDEILDARLKRHRLKYAELAKKPLVADLPEGGMVCWVVVDKEQSTFERHTIIRKALQLILEETPQNLTITVYGDDRLRQLAAEAAIYVALLNSANLPSRKTKQKRETLKKIGLYGWLASDGFKKVTTLASANNLTRCMTMLPPNDLTPGAYRKKIKLLATEQGWHHKEYDLKKLRKLGAGAFVAVAQGSSTEDAAIVHLSYVPETAQKSVALVGKGICFDTGGHNLKPSRYMYGMHEDMNGSAVALGILQAVTKAKLPIKIDCWLALAQNHIGPDAYKQNDVVTALNGKTIEIIHTDAEGRMVMADTLTLASRDKPDLILDFATLTGSMATALGDRMSGIMGNCPELLCRAVGVGNKVGERVSVFPIETDYDEDLDSNIADIKQCSPDSAADHILAARFLSNFIEGKIPWLHTDLSSSNRKGGLGAVASDVTGFGVGFGFGLIENMLN